MSMTDAAMRAEIEAILVSNAACLGEKPDIGLHVLRDGRVRIFTLALGWRRHPYTEYTSLAVAYRAALVSRDRAESVRALRASGAPTGTAVAAAIARHPAPWRTDS